SSFGATGSTPNRESSPNDGSHLRYPAAGPWSLSSCSYTVAAGARGMDEHETSHAADAWIFPCARLLIGSRAVSCWRLLGAVGLVCGSIVSMAAAAKSGLSPLSLLALHLVVCSLCVGYALARRKIVGNETHTLLEIFAIALAVEFLLTDSSNLPTLEYLDATVAGI